MKEDLFEEEKVDKNGKESSEVEETEESPWDELPEDTAEDEDVDTLLEDEETEMLPDIDEEEAEAPSDMRSLGFLLMKAKKPKKPLMMK